MGTTLLRINILREENEYGEMAYTVTPVYRTNYARVISVPDTKGWPTLAEAKAEAERIAGGKFGD
jgi:hypothetical protein